jgi:hypothetical protein
MNEQVWAYLSMNESGRVNNCSSSEFELLLSRVGVTINGFWTGWLDLLHTYTLNWLTKSDYSAIANFHALQSNVTSTRVLSLLQSPQVVSWQHILTTWGFFSFPLVNAPHLNSAHHLLNSRLTAYSELWNSKSNSESHCAWKWVNQ